MLAALMPADDNAEEPQRARRPLHPICGRLQAAWEGATCRARFRAAGARHRRSLSGRPPDFFWNHYAYPANSNSWRGLRNGPGAESMTECGPL
jgi:hypothetical protein